MKQELHEWRLKIRSIPSDSDTGGRLHFYRCLQEEPAPALCIYSSISTNRRQIIPMLRCGCLPLEVERGRYRSSKTPLRNRTCQLCNDGSISDEVHFLNECWPLQSAVIPSTASEAYNQQQNFHTLPPEEAILLLHLCSVNLWYVPLTKSLIHC